MTMNSNSVKDDLMVIFKEVIKFSLVAVVVMWTLGVLMLYLLVYVLKYDAEISAMVSGTVVAILVVVIEMKSLRTRDKVSECNRRIVNKLFRINEDSK